MNVNPDDPKWTAYVLGELSESEREEIEKELDTSAAARELVEEIRLATTLLKTEFAKEVTPELTPQQRAIIAAATLPRAPRPLWRWAGAAALAAAGLTLAVLVSVPGSRYRDSLPSATVSSVPLSPPVSNAETDSSKPAAEASKTQNSQIGQREEKEQSLKKDET